ncbi:MAG: CvpA family protein [Treponema sp.]|nr:CvpA family protein [Treponema sp.]
MDFAAVDIIFIALIVLFTVRCALRGFIGEFMSMASVVLGLLAALYFYKKGGELIRSKYLPDMKILPLVIAFVALFVIVFITIRFLEKLLADVIDGIRLGDADRFLGILFGFVEGVIVVSLVLFIFSIQPLFDPDSILANSFFARVLLPLITGAGGSANV